jgi:ribonucleotide monophosphatase NagD (HAD superfamily)
MVTNIIFDWKRTLYDPDTKTLISGTIEVLNFIKKQNIPLTLIGKGGDDMYQEVERLNVKNYFTNILFKEGEKEIETFRQYIDKINPKFTIIIGDRVRSELEVGNILETTTLWVKQGQFATEGPENENQKPDFIVNSLIEIPEILQKIL